MTPKKRILIVDQNINEQSPAMKGIIRSIPFLLERGYEFEAWCIDPPEGDFVEYRAVPGFRWMKSYNLWTFMAITSARAFLDRWVRGRERPHHVMVSGNYVLFCDSHLVHFVAANWLQVGFKNGLLKELKQLAFVPLWLVDAMLLPVQLLIGLGRKLVLPISHSVAGHIQELGARRDNCFLLPSPVDTTLFSAEVRGRHRETSREEFGIHESTRVFGFSSHGHYVRKGFWECVEALVARRGGPGLPPIRFLVFGGLSAAARSALEEELDRRAGLDWRDWLTLTGFVPQLEEALAACDYYLFPSHYETYALAPAEAAAMGIPIVVTRYDGHEMYAADHENGLVVDFGTEPLTAAVRALLEVQCPPSWFQPDVGEVPDQEGYADLLDQVFRLSAKRRGLCLMDQSVDEGAA